MNGWRKICYSKINQNEARVAILTSNLADFKEGKVIRDKRVNSPRIQSLTCMSN